ncbi:MAG: benzoyl-CoA-dihydrodiol lyase [Nevskiaceae bacterium]|nr:MAG: benzoyl-CoA-dihydrodiol lyase [Nevskiaceae bacterium]TBR73460.1 MAG: benzoyl-CoA-dihydrodiol lyase [Nevskiaceae bacterium]
MPATLASRSAAQPAPSQTPPDGCATPGSAVPVDYRTDPTRYRHWRIAVDGPVATLTLAVAEDGGIRSGYALKLNSYDLGVDIELHDAINRLRFEHPEVQCVVLTGGLERVFCSGANIFMLGLSTHPWKVNFCKFTNETRNGFEDSSRNGSLKFLAAINGACAGGGYEEALACDRILLVDDRSSAVSLPEVSLLGVLPGTGGLTRVTDKRHVRHDRADLFATSVEGVRGQRAMDWGFVDALAKPAQFAEKAREMALELAAQSRRPGPAAKATGVKLPEVERTIDTAGVHYATVDVQIDRVGRVATLTARAPEHDVPTDIAGIEVAGAQWWPLKFARELDDAILHLRTNELEIGTWVFRTTGDAARVLAADASLVVHREHWLVRETIGLLRRTLARLDVTSRSLFAFIDSGSCFAGTLAELALAADRSYMLDVPDGAAPCLTLSEANFGLYPMITDQSRVARRFYDDAAAIGAVRAVVGAPLPAEQAEALGLVTLALDDIDWDDEIRFALEERAAFSPDALTGMEANLRFNGVETLWTRVFGRLTAWQNWIFNRPNAVGAHGALKVYGTGVKAEFDFRRV